MIHKNSRQTPPQNAAGTTHPQPRTCYTGPTPEDLDRLPTDVKARRQWVLWRGADRLDPHTGAVKLNKIPIDPQTLRHADTTDPATWGAFAQCVVALPVALEEWEQEDPSAYRGGGIGFVFTAEDPYTGIDLDQALVGFQGRGFVDGVQPDFCLSLLLEALIFQ
jgi:hypothetical protein